VSTSPDPIHHLETGRRSVLYEVDRQRSRVSFRAKAFGLVWVRGQLPVAGGELQLDDDTLHGAGELDAGGIDTGLRARDWHLRTGHYLCTSIHPRIGVRVSGCTVGEPSATCSVTVRGHAEPMTIDIRRLEVHPEELHLTAHTTVDRTVFAMLPPAAGVSRLVSVDVDLVARRRSNAPSG
jgi:polyisoprenoid-binding protein YceI